MRKIRKRPVMQSPILDSQRGMLNRIRARAQKFGFKAADVRPFTLRLMTQSAANNSTIMFHAAIETKAHEMEIRLEKSDAFWANKVGLGVHKVLLDANGEEQPGNTPIIHYPDSNWFNGGGAGLPGAAANEAQALEMLYNSTLMFKTDQDIRLEVFDTRRLRHVPETQYDPNAPVKLWEHNGEEMKNISTNFGIWGNKRNNLEIKYKNGDFANIGGVAGQSVNYAVLLLDGFLLVRGAEAITLSDAAKIFPGL